MRPPLAICVFLLALSGCAQPAPSSPLEVHDSWRTCETEVPPGTDMLVNTDAFDLPHLGGDFAPVSITICGQSERTLLSGEVQSTAVEQRSDQVTDLIAALRLPDEPAGTGACDDVLMGVPWFVLHDAQGRWIRPGIPLDVCRHPREEVRTALHDLPLTTVSTRKTGVLTSAAAAKAGCDQNWGDMIAAEAKSTIVHPAPTGYAPPADAKVTLCRYAVPPAERADDKPGGDFTSGGPLTPADWRAIRAQLPDGVPAEPCTKQAASFAVLTRNDGNQIYVELDGCHRLWAGTDGLAQAPPALIKLLTDQHE